MIEAYPRQDVIVNVAGSGTNRTGDPTYTPRTVSCVVDERSKMVRDNEGNDVMSTATVYFPGGDTVKQVDTVEIGGSEIKSPIIKMVKEPAFVQPFVEVILG